MSSFEVKVDLSGMNGLVSLLEKLPVLVVMEGGPIDRAVTAASKVVLTRAREIVPDSSKTKSRDKQSKSSQSKWPKRLKNTLRTKLIRYKDGSWVVVGPRSKEGNMSHFMQEKPRKHVLWGKATLLRRYRIERNWITQAYDETIPQQLAAAEASLRTDIEANMRAAK